MYDTQSQSFAHSLFTGPKGKIGLHREGCLEIEDSHSGLVAVKNADVSVMTTANNYTEKEDLSDSEIIVACLRDPEGEIREVDARR